MTINYTFDLGRGSAKLLRRELRIHNVATVPPTLLHTSDEAATTETATVDLPENALLRATLTDVAVGGIANQPAVLSFCTNPAQVSFPSGGLRILCVEEMSSSSSLSSTSSRSSSSSSLSTSTLSSSSSSGTSQSSLSSSSSTSSASSSSSST